ncbi:MAG TPA: Tat pathway signal sequence domain protein [Caulobacteraceae bacterium]|nr:Tat pathway signal sequence domain protein [Caulobacteraceae bacterium]
MRRFAQFAFVASAAIALTGPLPAHAQGGGGQQQQQDEEDAKTRKRNEEWGTGNSKLNLPQLRNAGPCPYVKVLYDAARYVEMPADHASAAAVGFTGEIQNLSSACEYKNDQPIKVQARMLFEFGRGPTAEGARKTYRYWVAVTDRDRAVLQKEYFDIPVDFPNGVDRVNKVEELDGITIPRADLKVSGSNFEVLVGFDVTPQMAAFNRNGERFRVNAGETTQASAGR